MVDVLLEFGADPRDEDSLGRTALYYARRRLERLGPGPDKIHRSEALDEHGNLRLSPEEQAQIDETAEELRRDSPQAADEFVEMYLQERRKAALHQNMPRRELKIIIRRLEEAGDEGA